MKEYLQSLEETGELAEIHSLIDAILEEARAGRSKPNERRLFLRHLILNKALLENLATPLALDHLFSRITGEEWNELFDKAAEKEVPRLMVDLADQLIDLSHQEVLRFLPGNPVKALISILKDLDDYLKNLEESPRFLRGMRAARIQMDIYNALAVDPKIWKHRNPPACCIDNKEIIRLKENKQIEQLPRAYESRINQLQRRDLRLSLAALYEGRISAPRLQEEDYDKTFAVEAPLRLGISSANASDNHIRSKEQGGKTLNAGIDLQMEGESAPSPPLQVTARRLAEPQLILRSRSMDFRADFEVTSRGDAATQSELFFAYRRGGDEALRLVKQALVHTGIVSDNSQDIIRDIAAFAGDGGLEIITRSKVQQGSGLGTSSVLAAAILKVLYRLIGSPIGTPEHEYPALYDHSLLLEQNIGLNSGWQDARGAYGGPGAVKNFYAPPTAGLPAPQPTFLTDIDQDLFVERIILFDTGIARGATRGLNVVLDAYLSRDQKRYAAMKESVEIHDQMGAALGAGDYPALGALATRYWQLRCILDPGATSEALQYLFEAPELTRFTEGGLITGAGGGGFALLIAKEGQSEEVKQVLTQLKKESAYARSGVVEYCLDREGIRLRELT